MSKSAFGGGHDDLPGDTSVKTRQGPRQKSEPSRGRPRPREARDAVAIGGFRVDLARLWWAPVLVALLVGIGVASATQDPASNSSSAVINTRAAADEPDERFDLIRDLTAASQLSGVLEPIAESSDMSVRELREMLLVEQIGSSSLGRITVTSSRSENSRQILIEKIFESAKSYLSPPSAPRALRLAQEQQEQALTKYYGNLDSSDGLRPDVALERMQTRLSVALDESNPVLVAALRKQIPRATKRAQRLEALRIKLDQANTDLSAISVPAKRSVWTGPQALEIDFQTATAAGFTSDLSVRRGAGAGLAAGLLVVALIAFTGFARRRED